MLKLRPIHMYFGQKMTANNDRYLERSVAPVFAKPEHHGRGRHHQRQDEYDEGLARLFHGAIATGGKIW
jgi:hypothetical protein